MRTTSAALLAGSAVIAAQLSGRRYGPTPDHPRTAAWYAALRKPSFTLPDPVFAIAWTALDALLGYSGYRLLTARPSSSRTLALGAWGGEPGGHRRVLLDAVRAQAAGRGARGHGRHGRLVGHRGGDGGRRGPAGRLGRPAAARLGAVRERAARGSLAA